MFHTTLTEARWVSFPMQVRLLNIGAELKRLEHWLERGDHAEAGRCMERALELLDLSVATAHPGAQRREFCRVREVLRGVLQTEQPVESVRQLRHTLIGDR